MAQRRKVPVLVGEVAAEFAGTMILILFGVAFTLYRLVKP